MEYSMLGIALIVAVCNWVAVEKNNKLVERITKPAVMVLLLAWLFQNQLAGGGMIWFSLGIVFSLAGDVFLMLSGERYFLPGLIAFLLAHIAYIIGFNQVWPEASVLLILLSLGILVIAGILFTKLSQGLKRQANDALRVPVAIYTLVITIMVISALFTFTRPGWNGIPATIALAGAIAFMVSDSVLAWDKFVQPIRHARLIIMVTYHLGQVGILLGAVLHAGGWL